MTHYVSPGPGGTLNLTHSLVFTASVSKLCVDRFWFLFSHWFSFLSRTSTNLATSRRLERRPERNTVRSTILVCWAFSV